MNKKLFKIENFNIIQDEKNYYFIRALNMGDMADLENGIITENGKIVKIRTDRERYIENKNNIPKYFKDSKISLEQVYDHIKDNHRLDTNLISLSSNANVSLSYGKGYKDIYIIVKILKEKMGKKVINAGEYMLLEIEKKINTYILQLKEKNEIQKLKEIDKALKKIENAKNLDELKSLIVNHYKIKKYGKTQMKKNIKYVLKKTRILDEKMLNKEQSLEKNKVIAKLTYLEEKGNMKPVIQNTKNNVDIINTIGNAFSSLELLHYGDIEKEEIINTSKETIEKLANIQKNSETRGNLKKLNQMKLEVIRSNLFNK